MKRLHKTAQKISASVLLAGLLLFGFVTPVAAEGGYTWTNQTNAGTSQFYNVATSQDGNDIAAAIYGGGIQISTNAGATWTTQTGLGSDDWEYDAMSANGSVIAVTAEDQTIAVSTNGGSTWNDVTLGNNQTMLEQVAMSATGQYILVGDSNTSDLFVSNNYGATWTNEPSVGPGYWEAASVSATGQYMVLAEGGNLGYLYTSSDYGQTWTADSAAGTGQWNYTSISANGQSILAVDVNGQRLISSNNYGASWTQLTTPFPPVEISASSNNQYIALLDANNNRLYISTDGGSTWIEQTSAGTTYDWYSIAMSSDGSRVAGVSLHSNATIGDLRTAYDPALVNPALYPHNIIAASANTTPTTNTVITPAATTAHATVASSNIGTPDTGYGEPQHSNLVVDILAIGSIASISLGLKLIRRSTRL